MSDAMDAWIYGEAKPTQAGWHAVLVCWDAREGIYPGARYWTGSKWVADPGAPIEETATVSWLPGVRLTLEEAEDAAQANDPDQ